MPPAGIFNVAYGTFQHVVKRVGKPFAFGIADNQHLGIVVVNAELFDFSF